MRLDAPPAAPAPGAVPTPPRPLPEAGADSGTTAAALAAGFVSVAVGGTLYSQGFGAVMTLVVVLPLSWVLLSMFLTRPAAQPRRPGPLPARGPLKTAPPTPLGPASALLQVLKILGAVLFVGVATVLAAGIAVTLACAFLLSNAH